MGSDGIKGSVQSLGRIGKNLKLSNTNSVLKAFQTELHYFTHLWRTKGKACLYVCV